MWEEMQKKTAEQNNAFYDTGSGNTVFWLLLLLHSCSYTTVPLQNHSYLCVLILLARHSLCYHCRESSDPGAPTTPWWLGSKSPQTWRTQTCLPAVHNTLNSTTILFDKYWIGNFINFFSGQIGQVLYYLMGKQISDNYKKCFNFHIK
jgi:hypothetical protein